MRKLKAGIIDKLIVVQATSAEIDFLIWLSHYQNDAGIVRGVYYKDVAEELHISFQTFYNIKKSLEEKGVIKVSKDASFYNDWDIRILDNDFSGDDLRPGKSADNYLNTGLDVFYSQEFYNMKANEKLMTMLYIKIAGAGSPNYRIGTQKFYEKYTQLFNVTKRTIQNYLTSIRKWFSIGVKDRKYWINPLRKKVDRENNRTDRAERAKQMAKSLCHRFKLDEAKKAYVYIKELIEQYTYMFKNLDLEPIIIETIKEYLVKSNDGSADPHKWYKRRINRKFLHKLFRGRLAELDMI